MFDLMRKYLVRSGYFSFVMLLFILLALTACSAPETATEAPVSTSSVLIPLVEQADTLSEDQPAETNAGELDIGPADINCTSPAALTPSGSEGPYYKPDAPERSSLIEADMGGTRLLLTGYVLTQDCQPVPNAWIDFWQADDRGAYDNQGYRLRGHQFTDESGRYLLETIIPGEYPGRPPHIHVKVQPPDGPVVTTQLYFPDSAGNENDPLFTSGTLLSLQEFEDGFISTFNFIVQE